MDDEKNLTEEKNVEVMEFSLIEDEIDELIAKLQLLKETKESISFEVDEENEFLIYYEKSCTENESLGEENE